MSVVLSEHLPLLATAPDGIRKLRGLILELAVRGKLVPQDPKDEPASELLKRIALERARLEAEGVCKKSKEMPPVAEEEQPFALPSNWAWVRLPEVYFSISPSSNKLLSSAIQEAGAVPVIDQGKRYVAGYTDEVSMLIKIPGPVVIFGDHTTERKYVDFDFVAGADGVKILRPILQSEKFFFRQLEGFKLKERGYARHFKVLNDQLYALPPLAEQHRIVAKVDELMALCDRLEAEQADAEAAHAKLVETLLGTLTQSTDAANLAANWQRLAEHFDTLFTTESSLDALKQTILQLAVMGKLVPQNQNDEPASNSVSFARKIAKLPARAGLSHDDVNDKPFGLPDLNLWTWVTISDVAESRLGKMLDKQKNRGEAHPYLRNTNVHWFQFQLDSIKTMLFDPSELVEYLVEPGDVLICEGGHGIARSAVWEGEIPGMMFQKALHRVRPLPCLIGHYLAFCLRVYEDAGVLQRYYTGAGIPHFTGKALARVTFPLPPIAEQHRIVAKVDELMALCDHLKADLAESHSRQERLASTLIESALEAA